MWCQARPAQGEGRPGACAQPAPALVSTDPLPTPVFSFEPTQVETTDRMQDRKDPVPEATSAQRLKRDAFQATPGLRTLGRSRSVPHCTQPVLSNFIISGSKWACNFHFFTGLSNLLQMSPAGCNAFLPRKLFFLFSNFLVEGLPGWVTVLH